MSIIVACRVEIFQNIYPPLRGRVNTEFSTGLEGLLYLKVTDSHTEIIRPDFYDKNANIAP